MSQVLTHSVDSRLHVKIQDKGNQVYQIPEEVLPRPEGSGSADGSILKFEYTEEPFSFSVVRADTEEVLFDTSAAPLVFESQYLRLRTNLPEDPYLYGLGEHTDPFRLNTTDYIRTLWNHDNYGIPSGTNIYGSHPFYVEQREGGSHGVFFMNSNGMDVFINNTADAGQYLEYNVLGGVLDYYFFAGPSPPEVVKQYSEVVGAPAMQPYWGLGFHQCRYAPPFLPFCPTKKAAQTNASPRYGYQDIFEVAEVVYNYSQAGIPLETMWTDIDYMDGRATFTLDDQRFPVEKVRQVVDYLHERDQNYIMMVNPSAAYRDESPTIERGLEDGVYLKYENGSVYLGAVWPGVTVFPDWFHENVTEYWNREFEIFFSPETGVDIDGLWIDMNEPASFCEGLCEDPWGDAREQELPPPPPAVREVPRPLPGFSCDFQPPGTTDCEEASTTVSKRQELSPRSIPAADRNLQARQEAGDQKGLPDRDLLFPEYTIRNHAAGDDWSDPSKGGLSFKTVKTDITHQNGLAMYDTHNLYGAMMGQASRAAMISRRPGLRPLVITRSSFPGDGRSVGHWLGDNVASWEQYRFSIHTTLSFSALYQFSMAGSDVCGFAEDTNEELCARWASLGAFFTFYRNHNDLDWVPQEFYRWDTVAESARKAIDIRYRLLDYIYTAMYKASIDGTPVLNPMFFLYPEDKNTWALQHQFFYGDGLLVAPVLEENATSVDAYLPKGVFYDWYTHEPIIGTGAPHTFSDQDTTDIPLLIRGGAILPLRTSSANTTAELRTRDFEIIVALDAEGTARGELYLDDGVSLEQEGVTYVEFRVEGGVLYVDGEFGFDAGVKICSITVLDGGCVETAREGGEGSKTLEVELSLAEAGSVALS